MAQRSISFRFNPAAPARIGMARRGMVVVPTAITRHSVRPIAIRIKVSVNSWRVESVSFPANIRRCVTWPISKPTPIRMVSWRS